MKQILTCAACDYSLSDAVNIFDSSMPNCPILRMDGWETSVADKGVCFKSNVDLIDAFSAFQSLRDENTKPKFFLFSKKKPKGFSLHDVEVQVEASEVKADHICFSHLRFIPQFWMSIFDIMFHLETKEYVSWGWEGTNSPNVFCPNCDTLVGTEITYTKNIPDTFIPDNEKTKWQNEIS